jgi:8-oxo-dGTP pyrophosphatase MutT (NUDIX family)
MTAIPKPSATVILLREPGNGGLEVFLLKRSEKSSFMAGAYVYPGGMVDGRDRDPQIFPLCRGISGTEDLRCFTRHVSGSEAVAFQVAAIRELFEEAGILIACSEDGNQFTLSTGKVRARFAAHRESLQDGKHGLVELLRQENLYLALDRLHPYAHWITPEVHPLRFDTRFFLVACPEGQEAHADMKETVHGVWLSPGEALARNRLGTLTLSPPTLKTLEDLSRFRKMGALFLSLRGRLITTVLPVFMRLPGHVFVVFPEDPDYEAYRRGKTGVPLDHGRPSLGTDATTRVVFRDGFVLPYHKSP